MVTSRLLLTVAVLIAFGSSILGPFQYDDPSIFNFAFNPWLTRPLTYLTFWLNLQFAGPEPWLFHLTNLATHLACTHLLLTCLNRLIPSRAALIAAFVFAIHPIQTEAVAYIFARSGMLATLFCLVALYLWITDRPWLAAAAFAVALAAKEECAAFPAVLFLLDRKRLKPIAAMFALALLAVARVAWVAAITPGSGAGAQAGITPVSYFLTQGYVILRYFQLLAVPIGLSVDHDIPILSYTLGLACWASLALLIYLARIVKRLRWFLAGILLLLPTSSIFPAADLATERRLYLPLIAFAAFIGLALESTPYRWMLHSAAVVLIAMSAARAQVWLSPQTLWEDALRQAPTKVRPRLQLARVSDPPRAHQLLDEARTLAPDNPDVASDLGRLYLLEGKPREALVEFGRALALKPDDPRLYNNRAVALCNLGFREPAAADFRRALELNPNLKDVEANRDKCAATPSAAN